MQKLISEKKTLLATSITGYQIALIILGIALLMQVTGCSILSDQSVREIKVPVKVEIPRKVLCQTLTVPKIPTPKLTWHPVPVAWIKQYIPTTSDKIEQEQHDKLLEYTNSLPGEIIGLSPGDYEQFGFFFIDLESWMKSKNAQVDLLKSCIERHNIQADEFSSQFDD